MRHFAKSTIAALCWYALIPLLGIVAGEAVYFPWPHLFMMWIGLESTAGLVVALLVGFIAIAAAGLVLQRWAPTKSTGLGAAAVWGLILAIGTVAVLLLGAWVVATLAGWPTSA